MQVKDGQSSGDEKWGHDKLIEPNQPNLFVLLKFDLR